MTTPPAPLLSPQPPGRRFAVAGRLLLAVALLGVIGLVVWGVCLVARSPHTSASDIPALRVTPAAVQPGAAAPAAAPGVQPDVQPQAAAGQDPVMAWADRMARAAGVPSRALRAYGQTDLALRTEKPRCQVSWATLAGIGRVESDHGRYGGAALGPDGRPSRAIVGVVLDGSGGVRSIPDTDGGRLDGDTAHDRAVGPMQFIPATWARWAADGDGDGRADPQDIDDAALAAGRYLCADGRDLGSPAGWWAAVLSYNNSVDYAQRVFGVADAYARRSV